MAAGGGPSKAVDRAIGVLVAACASALLVALGARAGSSLTTFLRLAYGEHVGKRGGKRRSTEEEGGDAYFEYAHGSRSAAATARARARTRQGGEAGGAGGGRLVSHVGSCHCGGLAFEVEAPEHLVAIEGPSKVCLGWVGLCCVCAGLVWSL